MKSMFMDDVWWICGEYMVNIWWIYGEYMVNIIYIYIRTWLIWLYSYTLYLTCSNISPGSKKTEVCVTGMIGIGFGKSSPNRHSFFLASQPTKLDGFLTCFGYFRRCLETPALTCCVARSKGTDSLVGISPCHQWRLKSSVGIWTVFQLNLSEASDEVTMLASWRWRTRIGCELSVNFVAQNNIDYDRFNMRFPIIKIHSNIFWVF